MPSTEIQPSVAFTYNGVDVLYDADRLVSLTAMWKAAGSPENQSPKHFAYTSNGKGFIASVMPKSDSTKNTVWKTKRGGKLKGETFAHWQIALAYAKYLSHEFHQHVNACFMQFKTEEKNPGLKMERAVAAFEKAGRDARWIEQRFQGIGARNAFTSTLAAHNVNREGYPICTRSISLQVIGKTPREFKAEQGLPMSAKTRDHLNAVQLSGLNFAETMARQMIIDRGADGNDECLEECRRAGKAVKVAMSALTAPIN